MRLLIGRVLNGVRNENQSAEVPAFREVARVLATVH